MDDEKNLQEQETPNTGETAGTEALKDVDTDELLGTYAQIKQELHDILGELKARQAEPDSEKTPPADWDELFNKYREPYRGERRKE